MRFSRRHAIAAATIAALTLGACGTEESTNTGQTPESSAGAGGVQKVVVGASPVPHAKILEFVRDNLAADAGLTLEIKEFDDYVLPNEALASGELDANYFQHLPYLENQIQEKGFEFEHGTGIHIEPLALFSKKHDTTDAVPDGGVVAITNDPSNQFRGLKLLEQAGLLKDIQEGDTVLSLAEAKNPKKLTFEESQPEVVVQQLDDPKVDVAVINANFLLGAGLKTSDAIAVEAVKDNPYANVLVWRKDNSNAGVAKLEELLHSKEVADYIRETWPSGDVLPGGTN